MEKVTSLLWLAVETILVTSFIVLLVYVQSTFSDFSYATVEQQNLENTMREVNTINSYENKVLRATELLDFYRTYIVKEHPDMSASLMNVYLRYRIGSTRLERWIKSEESDSTDYNLTTYLGPTYTYTLQYSRNTSGAINTIYITRSDY